MDVLIEFGPNVRRGVRMLQWGLFDIRWIIAAAPVVAESTAQIGLFHQSRLALYGCAILFGGLAGVVFQFSQPKFTAFSCFSSFLSSGLFGLMIMLAGLETDIGLQYPGCLLAVAIAIGLCGPAATSKLQQIVPDAMATFLHAVASWAAGRLQKADQPPKPPKEPNP